MALLRLKIIGKEEIAKDAVLLRLEQENGKPIEYQAGQFLTLILEIYERELRRSYSICTTPEENQSLAIVIKRQVNGEVSRYIIDHVQVGDVLTALPPAGRFTLNIAESAGKHLFFIAAGSGISPVFSLLKKALQAESLRVTLIYQNHDEWSTIFRQELETLSKLFEGRFEYMSLLTAPTDDSVTPQRLNNYLLEKFLKEHSDFRADESLFYICGPRAFMRMAVFVIRLLHVPDKHIRQEEYIVDLFPPPPFMTDHTPKNLTIQWEGEDYQMSIQYPESILESALRHKLKLPYSCRGGKCSTCIAKCTSGKVKMSINQVLTENDLREGWILTCVGFAETDVRIEL